MSIDVTVKAVLEALKTGLTFDKNPERVRCYDLMIGSVLDIGRRKRLNGITPYVDWLMQYRKANINTLYPSWKDHPHNEEHIYWR